MRPRSLVAPNATQKARPENLVVAATAIAEASPFPRHRTKTPRECPGGGGDDRASGRRDQAGLAARKRRVGAVRGAVRGAVPAQNEPKSDRPRAKTPMNRRKSRLRRRAAPNVREAVDRAGVNVLAVRSRAGVLAFGADGDVRTAFDPYGITHFDLQPLDTNRQRYDSSERGLLNDALVLALTRHCGLTALRDRGRILVPAKPEEAVWSTLRKLTRQLSGVVDKHPELRWWEGVGVRLDWASDRLWVLIEPRIALEGVTDENRAAATDFVRERTVRRYNRELNDLIDFWASHLAAGGGELRGLNVTAGIDAIFRLSSVTAFSRRSSS